MPITTITCSNKNEFIAACKDLSGSAIRYREDVNMESDVHKVVGCSRLDFILLSISKIEFKWVGYDSDWDRRKEMLAVTEQWTGRRKMFHKRKDPSLDYIAASVASFIKTNHERFFGELLGNELKAEILTLKLCQLSEVDLGVKNRIADLIEKLEECRTGLKTSRREQKAFNEKVEDLQEARTKSEKILGRVNVLEKEIRDLEKKIMDKREEKLHEGDQDSYLALRNLIGKKKTLEEKTHSKLLSSDYYEDIVATEVVREALGLPKSFKQEALQHKKEMDNLQARMTIMDERLLKLENFLQGVLPKVLLRCKDGNHTAVYGMLKEVEFFEKRKTKIENGSMSKTSLTDEETRADEQLLFACDFSDYSTETIRTYLDFRRSGSIPSTEENTLLELYRLANYVGDLELLPILGGLIDDVLSNTQMLSLLKNSPFNSTVSKDAVLEIALEKVLQNFKSLIDEPDFFDLNHDLIVEILKRDDIVIFDEFELYQAVLKWAAEQAKREGKTVESVIYEGEPGERIVDLIRFEHIPCKQFLEISHTGLLKKQERIKWLEFYIGSGTPLARSVRGQCEGSDVTY